MKISLCRFSFSCSWKLFGWIFNGGVNILALLQFLRKDCNLNTWTNYDFLNRKEEDIRQLERDQIAAERAEQEAAAQADEQGKL